MIKGRVIRREVVRPEETRAIPLMGVHHVEVLEVFKGGPGSPRVIVRDSHKCMDLDVTYYLLLRRVAEGRLLPGLPPEQYGSFGYRGEFAVRDNLIDTYDKVDRPSPATVTIYRGMPESAFVERLRWALDAQIVVITCDGRRTTRLEYLFRVHQERCVLE